MPRLVKNLCNSRKVVFDKGRFDNWCVYIIEADGSKTAPRDVQYFTDLQAVSECYHRHKVYDDFTVFYDITDKNIDEKVLQLINESVFSYRPEHRSLIEQWFTVIYAGMIAEENKAHAILKKRVKRLGMYQVLIQGMAPVEAAVFSTGKKWTDLNTLMQNLGF